MDDFLLVHNNRKQKELKRPFNNPLSSFLLILLILSFVFDFFL